MDCDWHNGILLQHKKQEDPGIDAIGSIVLSSPCVLYDIRHKSVINIKDTGVVK